MNLPDEFKLLVDAFASLPSIGKKTAQRLALYVLNQSHFYIHDFTTRIKNAKDSLKFCMLCHNLCTSSICSICSSSTRDQSKICIVTSLEDLLRIEDSGSYDGLYYILEGELNDKKRFDHVITNINLLVERLKDSQSIQEVIIATNYSLPGESTAHYIADHLKDNQHLNLYRIGFGLPMNSALDYADNNTLRQAFINKRAIYK